MMIEHQEAEILDWEVNPNPNMKIILRAHVYTAPHPIASQRQVLLEIISKNAFWRYYTTCSFSYY